MANPNVIAQTAFGPMIVNVNDRYITREIFTDGHWAIDDVRLLMSIIEHQLTARERMIVYDVGANIGAHCLGMASLGADRVAIRAFEAQREMFHMLCGTMALNGARNVLCHHAAVSDTDGETIALSLPDYERSNNFGGFEVMAPRRSDNADMIRAGADTVRTVTIDAFDEAVGLIKLDIEGMEDRALTGARRTVAKHRPICFVELTKTDADFVQAFFRDQDYRGYLRREDLIAIPAESNLGLAGLAQLF
ncbi:MAG: FkbM family methyltransferase [Proteobacteria bacterium]|nr:FkbM family methyltransferase [Pseudomonadota bacterium]